MTLPYQRTRAVVHAEEILAVLVDCEERKYSDRRAVAVPEELIERAQKCLHHYPTRAELASTAKRCPDLWVDIEEWE